MIRSVRGVGLLVLLAVAVWAGTIQGAEVGFGKADITPDFKARPVWIAGYGNGRQATGVHDPIESRAIVVKEGDRKVALVSVDLIGVQLPLTDAVRKRLPGYEYVLVGSTHNHEGPDVIGLWGPTERESGVDAEYLMQVEEGVVASVKEAERNCVPAVAFYGEAEDESLMADARLPIAKDGVLRAIRFETPEGGRTLAILVQFSCHPEDLESRNTLLTSDFPHYTRKALEAKHGAPVAYFTGMVGGLMTGPEKRFLKPDGSYYEGGDWEFARVHGEAVADLAGKAMESAERVSLSPLEVRAERVQVPLANQGYRVGRAIGVLPRQAFEWQDDPFKEGKPIPMEQVEGPIALQTEVSYLRLGDVHVAGLPGEIYPELIYGKYQEPVEPNVDFPTVALEPPVMTILPGKKVLLLGLANDEIGYVLPKRQWDQEAPFAYGRERGQYGEVNSVGPEAGPILIEALRRLVSGEK